MAKQTVSPAERHLEKGVLGIAVLALAAVVVKFLISSPNNIDLGGRTVTPAEVYGTMVSDADQLRDRIKNKKLPADTKAEDQTARLEGLLGAKPEPVVATVVPFGAQVPDLTSDKVEQGNIELVKVLPFGKPTVKVGRSGMELLPPEPVMEVPNDPIEENIDQQYVVPVNWVTVSATFDVDAQRQLAESKRYLPGQAVPYLVGAEVQRREKRWDGTYTDWEPVKTYARYVLPDLPFVEVEEKDGKRVIAETTIPKVDAFRNVVGTGWYRIQLMRPLAAKIDYGDWWDPPQFDGLDLLRMDDEVLNPPPDTPACPLYDRYPKKAKIKPTKDMTDDDRKKQKRESLERRVSEIEVWTKQGCYEAALASAKELLLTAVEDIKGIDPKKLPWLEQQRDQLEALVIKAKREEEEREKKKQTLPPRELLPQQVVWIHDAMKDSVISGRTYQYRMRPLLFNNLCAQIMQLKDPKDAEIVLLQGEWSTEGKDVSDDVSIPSDTEFFLARGKEDDKTAKIEVFKWHEGEWLRSSFDVSIGDRIGGRASVRVGGGPATRVDFDTGARVVDLRFDHAYRERKEKRGGFDFGEAKPSLAMVFVDAFGEIHQRVLEEDKRHPRLKELKDAIAQSGGPPGP